MNRKLLVSFIFVLVVVVFSVPKQNAYLERIAEDYGAMHQGMALSPESLASLGEFEFQNHLLFSKFEYQFGNVSVSYFGFLSFIVFQKSEIKERTNPPITV